MNLATSFALSAEKHRDKTAVFWGDTTYRFEALLDQSSRLAWHLISNLGLRPLDRVALWLKNCPEFVPSFFGVLQGAGVVVPINNFLKPGEITFILEDAGIDVLITDETLSLQAEKLRAARPSLKIWGIEEFATLPLPPSSGTEALPGQSLQASDLAVIIYTSGTTGRPKGAMLSHGNLLSNVESCRQVLEAVEADRFVVLLPMFHSFMLCVGVVLPLLVGGSMVLIKSLHPAKNIVQEILQRRATILPAIPQFFRTLANAPLPAEFPLRICISGGAPLPLEILREFNEKMPIPLIEGYGLSEASPVVSINPIRGPRKEGSIGLPIPGVELTIQNEDGTILGPRQIGELCVRGGNVMLGYWNQPEETAKVLRNGWLFTGDIGYQDESGHFYITDRKKDMLLVNGINVYPREIEEVIYQFPGIKEAAVVGIRDPRRGEQPVAFVAPQEGARLQEKALLLFVRERLADYKVPRRVIFLPALPRNATGKILKTALREQAQDISVSIRDGA
jgi:long-chain acyl-CoA synthetase